MGIQKLMASMTLAQKAAQLTQLSASMLEESDIAITGSVRYLDVTKEQVATCGSMLNMSTPESRVSIQKKHMA